MLSGDKIGRGCSIGHFLGGWGSAAAALYVGSTSYYAGGCTLSAVVPCEDENLGGMFNQVFFHACFRASETIRLTLKIVHWRKFLSSE